MPPNATVESAMDGTSRCGRFPSPNVIEQEHGTGKRSKGQRHDAAQACAPPVRVDDGPAHDGPDRGTCRHHDAGHAHGGSALLHGKHEHGNHRYQRKQHAGCGRLQHASADQQEKRRGSCAKRRSRGKRPRCGEEQLTGGETVDQKGGNRHHDAADQRVYGHDPLRRGGIDGEVGHDDGQGGGHDGLIE